MDAGLLRSAVSADVAFHFLVVVLGAVARGQLRSATARAFTPAFARLVVCELFQQAPVGHIRVQPDVLREGDRHVDAPIEPHGFSGDVEDSLEPDIYFVDIDASVRLLSARVGR